MRVVVDNTLKGKVDEILGRVYYLTDAIKALGPIAELQGNVETKKVLVETLREYQNVSENAREILAKYIRQERERGATPIEYYRIYRKLGEDYNE